MRESNFFTKKLDCCCRKNAKPCLQPKNCKRIILHEPDSSRLWIDNPKGLEFYRVKVDGCLFKRGVKPKRCDWAIYSASYDRLLLVELKRKYPEEGPKQLETTTDFFGEPLKTLCILVHKCKNLQKTINELEQMKLRYKSIKVSWGVTNRKPIDFVCLLTYEMPKAGSR